MITRASHSDGKMPGKGYKYVFELTRKQVFLWSGLIFVAMAWMFTLGLYVGRGLSPIRFDIQDIKKELIALKEAAAKREKETFGGGGGTASAKPELDFYEVLTDKKKEALIKSAKSTDKERMPERTATEVRKGLLTVQVASLKNGKEAQEIVARLKDKGYDAYEVSANIPGKGVYHRVRVGHFGDSSDAGRLAAKLKQDNFEAIIVRE